MIHELDQRNNPCVLLLFVGSFVRSFVFFFSSHCPTYSIHVLQQSSSCFPHLRCEWFEINWKHMPHTTYSYGILFNKHDIVGRIWFQNHFRCFGFLTAYQFNHRWMAVYNERFRVKIWVYGHCMRKVAAIVLKNEIHQNDNCCDPTCERWIKKQKKTKKY